ncbi:hypothetical protein L208DRAFT_1560897 [Tricholoma matsutake]|nr:hypothetical protein L208DRAFT_1560897 [Tricholoma matsutake 945]
MYIHMTLTKVLPEGSEAVEWPFGQYIDILENHDQFIAAAGKEHEEGEEEEEEETHPTSKKARLDASSDSSKPAYPWNSMDVKWITLSVDLEKTWKLLRLYSGDPKGAKSDLLNQPNCPEFPDGEWKNILVGCAVNLDNVLSGYHSTSNNDEHIEILGDLKFKVPSVSPNKIVSTMVTGALHGTKLSG